MALNFGMTWWGAQWLNALINIDFDNRLARGANYARKGAVSKIEIKDNIIKANVIGSRVRPYRTEIRINKFDQEQIDSLINRILEHPSILSKLLNRELDPQLLPICNVLGLKVFPHSWRDFGMECSCPDWAVPCKHLAAVIYMMSLQIDNNPFIIFKLHGIDFQHELQKRGISFNSDKGLKVASFSSLLNEKDELSEKDNDIHFQRIDFSQLHNIKEEIGKLLEEKPAFYPFNDFHKIFKQNINKISKTAEKILNGKLSLEQLFIIEPEDISKNDKVEFKLDADYNYSLSMNPYKDTSIHKLFASVLRLNPDYLSNYDISISSLNQIVMAALHLMSKGCIIPQIIGTKEDTFTIRWLPATIDSKVSDVINSLEKIVPFELLTGKLPKKKTYCPIEKQCEHLLSHVISSIIPCIFEKFNDKIMAMFFNGMALKFNGVSEKEIPGSIKSWLDRLFLSKSIYKPSIMISENESGNFTLDIIINYQGDNISLRSIFSENKYEKERFDILKELSLLSSFVKDIDTYINSKGEESVQLSLNSLSLFIIDVTPAVRLLGINIILPKSLQDIIRPRPSMKISKKETNNKSYIRIDDLLTFDWQVAIGDEILSEDDFMKLIGRAEGLIRFKNKYIYVQESDLERLSKLFSSDKGLAQNQILQAAISESYDKAKIELSDDVRNMIDELRNQPEVTVPEEINATLRPYQERGFSWMYNNMKIGFGSIIADDMGLGKTLQVITLLQKIKNDGLLERKSAIVIVPTGLLSNWEAEIGRFAPKLSVFTYHGQQRDIKKFKADILLTTYGVLRSDIDILKKKKWEIAIIDEAQNIKNANTAQSKAVRNLPATTHIAMSGTPVENRLSEFWSIMDFANKSYLGSINHFQQNFEKPIHNDGDQYVAELFRKVTAPFMMRRLKTDKSIINDLPDKIELNETTWLSEYQASLYEQTLNEAMKKIEGIEDVDNQSLFKRQGLVLQMILALKQICNHPSLFLKNLDYNPEHSGKTVMLMDILRSIIESEQKVLIFTQFKEMGDILQHIITDVIGERPLFLHGGCTVNQRKAMVESFQNNKNECIFILSLKAAGTGLNLTAASHVIHYDLWWNPAVEAQATDRAYRIGQHQNVMVHRFITKNTFEERIDAMIQDKKHLAEMTVATGESWIGKLSNSELREIFEIV